MTRYYKRLTRLHLPWQKNKYYWKDVFIFWVVGYSENKIKGLINLFRNRFDFAGRGRFLLYSRGFGLTLPIRVDFFDGKFECYQRQRFHGCWSYRGYAHLLGWRYSYGG